MHLFSLKSSWHFMSPLISAVQICWFISNKSSIGDFVSMTFSKFLALISVSNTFPALSPEMLNRDYIKPVSQLTLSAYMDSVCILKLSITLRMPMSHNLIVWSLPAVTQFLPSGLIIIFLT